MFGALFLLGLFGLTAITVNRGLFNNAGNHNLGPSPLLKTRTGATTVATPLQRLALLARAKRPIPTALLNDALHEAYARGDWKVIDAITRRLETAPEPVTSTAGEDVTTSIVI